jgi:signal transduction histidine kinase
MIKMLIDQAETDQIPEHLDQIDEQVTRLTQQLENLRVLSLLNNPVTEACDPNAIAEIEIQEKQLEIEARGLKFTFLPDPAASKVRAHAKELQLAVGHLLDNAISYTPAEGSVCLKVEHDDDQVMIHISDTGIGIEPGDEPNIFDFFYRTALASEAREDGVGLGLAIAKLVAEAYGGKITFQSKLGEGSMFTLVMPAYDQIKKEPAM